MPDEPHNSQAPGSLIGDNATHLPTWHHGFGHFVLSLVSLLDSLGAAVEGCTLGFAIGPETSAKLRVALADFFARASLPGWSPVTVEPVIALPSVATGGIAGTLDGTNGCISEGGGAEIPAPSLAKETAAVAGEVS